MMQSAADRMPRNAEPKNAGPVCSSPLDAVGLEYDEAVLEVAALIAAGRVLSYGDIAELLGSGGPRQVGKAMSRSGSSVCWWRVLRADGTLPADLQVRAAVHWAAEKTALRAAGVLMKAARWQPTEAEHQRIDAIAARLPVPRRRIPDGPAAAHRVPNRRTPLI